jgi:hypothetical protein
LRPISRASWRKSASLSLRISGGAFIVPSVFSPTDDEDLYTLTEPFSLTGHWNVGVQGQNGNFLFDDDIAAHGQVRLVLGADRATGNSIISQVIYDFEGASPSPVPEPATLTLLGLGAASIAARKAVRNVYANSQALNQLRVRND